LKKAKDSVTGNYGGQMKLSKYFFLAALPLFLLLFLPKPNLARASSSLSPGFYVGWISYVAKTDFDGHLTTEAGTPDEILMRNTMEGRGQMMFKINDSGSGGASIVLPTEITRMDFWSALTPQGDSIYTIGTSAGSNYVYLRGAPAPMGDTFQVTFKPAAGLYFRSQNGFFTETGTMGGTEGVMKSSMPTEKTLIKQIAASISAIQFQIKYHTDTEIGGTCSIPGWVNKYPVPGFKELNVYSLPKCIWRVFKSDQSNAQKGWK
jgi:hypothetical protein